MNIVAPTWDDLASIFESETEWIFISSPWFSAEGIEKLNVFLPNKKLRKIKNIEIWFRMNIEDHLLGITDYESLLNFVEKVHKQSKGNTFKLYSSDSLHAKVYASNKKILITSANLTKKGFVDNIEIGIDTTLSASLKDAFDSFIKEQRKHLDEVSVSKLRNFVKQLESKTLKNYNQEISKILKKARSQMSLLALEEKYPPHSKFPIR
jgi:phosphatidylserine/phosphatidylglycerophosphate/cardiolipin synthase-like enzyme